MEEKILSIGTEVLVFNYISEWGPNQNEKRYIKGIVKSRKESDNLSLHGSPWYEQVYTVLGEDGIEYYGTYGTGLLGNSFFRTIDDHIKYLESKILSNNEKIEELKNHNNSYVNEIELLKEIQLNSIINKIPKDKFENIINHYSQIGSLDFAIIYPADGNHINLLLTYSNWNYEIEMLSHGLFFQNFDEKNNIDLELGAAKTEDVIDTLNDTNIKLIYGEKQIKKK